MESIRRLVKADFSSGDEVFIRFKHKDYRGVVDLARDEESVAKREPERENSHSDHTTSGNSRTLSPSAATRSRKRKRLEHSDVETGMAAKRSKSVDDPRSRLPTHKSVTRKNTRIPPRPKKSVMPGIYMHDCHLGALYFKACMCAETHNTVLPSCALWECGRKNTSWCFLLQSMWVVVVCWLHFCVSVCLCVLAKASLGSKAKICIMCIAFSQF